jgi:hypothetical protein
MEIKKKCVLPCNEPQYLGRMRSVDEERSTCAQRIEPSPPLSVIVVPIEPNAIEVHLPPARPERAPFLRINVDDGAQHVAVVLGAPAAAAEARDAGRAGVAAARAEEDRDGVDVRVVEEEAGWLCVGEERRGGVHARYLVDGREWKGKRTRGLAVSGRGSER